jgi:hypothetical protein
MTITIVVLLAALVLLLGVHVGRAQDATPTATPQTAPAAPPSATTADPFAFADFTWLSANPRTLVKV